jgi:ADP-ribosylglycohydrolase
MPNLFDKIYGCLAGSWIGSAMGAPVEGWSMQKIADTYGVLDTLVPYRHDQYEGVWDRPAGTTEDGIERQKLMCTAIIEKQDRITARDLVDTWIKVIDPEKMKYMSEPFDYDLAFIAKRGLMPADGIGAFSKFPHLVILARSFHAVPIINAGDMEGMIRDLYELGRVYQPVWSDAFAWGIVYNAAIIEAFEPDSTVDSVLETALTYASDKMPYASCTSKSPAGAIQQAIDIGSTHGNPLDIRKELNEIYCDVSGPYAISLIYENVAKALAIFAATKGDVRQAVVCGANFGRDTDCLCASAGGLAGAFSGTDTIPAEWIDTVEEATRGNPYTNSRRSLKETAEGMYRALQAKTQRMRNYTEKMQQRFA